MFEIKEAWKPIPNFSNYLVNVDGEIFSTLQNRFMKSSTTLMGHRKITLVADWDGERYTRSVAQIVAEAFVDPPNFLCDQVILLDGDFMNLKADNLAWRPRWFAWKYARQLKIQQPVHYHNLRVINLTTGRQYASIVEAGITEGLLFHDIWRSTYTGTAIFPNKAIFEVLH